jgi:cell division protein FtsI/penicillin-binding protein 2
MGTLYENQDVAGIPFFCNITAINNDKDNPSLNVAWDGGEETISYEGIRTMGEAWLKWKLGSWAIFDRSNVSDFLKNFHEGEQVPVYFVKNNEKNGEESLMLWEIPDLEGGIIVLKNGMIKAMVGGFFDRYFNRAADAKRQLGSIFKPLVYTAALQLRWNNLDQLNNVPDLFKFENTYYIPRPDHEPKSNKVSMTWAGAKSENLATVWLLYHLTDRLNMDEFREVVKRLGLAREKTETYNEYARRIRDTHGVVVNQEALMEAAFEDAKEEIESDLIFSGNEAAFNNISSLHFDIDNNGLDLKDESDFKISQFCFKKIRSLNYNMIKRFKDLLQLIEIYKKKGIVTDQDLKASLRYFYYNKIHDTNRIIYSEEPDKTHYNDLEGITLEQLSNRTPFISPEEIWIEDIIPSEAIDLIQTNMSRRYRELLALNRYDLETLYSVRDFRTLVNLFYVKQLAKEMGISTKLDPVLSFPLGANSISILEAALSYNTIVSGSFYPLSKKGMSDMVPVITKIVDRNNEMIWEYVPKPEKVLTERVSGSITEILRMVMENGTGRNAYDSVRLSMNFDEATLDIPIPAFGKTGTANLFTNSSFVGVIPGLERNKGEFDIDEGYVVASYVGYDDNRPMKGRHINIYGSSGALPLWIDTCNVIANSSGYKEGLQVADLAFLTQSGPLLADRTLSPAKVSLITGLPFAVREEEASSEVIEVYSDISTDGDVLTLKRAFEPLKGIYNDNNK